MGRFETQRQTTCFENFVLGYFAHLHCLKSSSSQPLMRVIGLQGKTRCLESCSLKTTYVKHRFFLSGLQESSKQRLALKPVAACSLSRCPFLWLTFCPKLSHTHMKTPLSLFWEEYTEKQTCHAKTKQSYLHLCFAVLMNVRMFFLQRPVR